MIIVEPIRDEKKITQIKNQLRGSGKIRDLLLFELGINSALRISDLLTVKVGDVFEDDGTIKDSFSLKEEKTKKSTSLTIVPNLKITLAEYRKIYPQVISDKNSFLFFHQKIFPQGKKSINRGMAWILINQRCENIGLKGNYGGHTLRKTRGYQARIKGVAMELIQHKLNHSSMKITMRYLGITDAELHKECNNLNL